VRVLDLPRGASPRAWGQLHGESYRGEIQSLAVLRTYLSCKVGRFPDAASVRACAEEHLPVLARYDAALHEELLGIAEGAAVSPADIVVVNHYTDLRDLDPDPTKRVAAHGHPRPVGDADGGCSVIWAKTPSGTLLGQTWDMHATAIPYVMMLHVPDTEHGPESWLLSLTGCLGMAGMNRLGLGMCINNLNSTDARVGVVWPALVRRALRQQTALAAFNVVIDSPVGSGHHYLVADPDEVWGVETSGVRREPMFHGETDTYVHANHCLDERVAEVSIIPPTSTTRERQAWLERSVAAAAPRDVADLWQRLGSEDGYPKSVCTNMSTPENPHGSATCGAIAMHLERRQLYAAPGLVHNVRPERFAFSFAGADLSTVGDAT
jgi:isopenicillin-N N-acyltransferase-like protein